jgi:ankyrin repeat protein
LLPALQIQTVLEGTTIRERKDALDMMPEEFQDAFKVTIDRIKRQRKAKSKHAMNILRWIFLATRPLSIDELQHALAVDPNNITSDLDRQNFLSEPLVLECCLGLVILDEVTSAVRLVHKALRDRLLSEYERGTLFEDGHSKLAVTCLTYMRFNYPLNHKSLGSLSAKTMDPEVGLDSITDLQLEFGKELLKEYVFLEYCICNWFHHVKESTSPMVTDLVMKFLVEDSDLRCISRHLSTWPILIAEDQRYGLTQPIKSILELGEATMKGYLSNKTSSVSGLHLAAFYGLEHIITNLAKNPSLNINAEFRPGASSLLFAVIGNHDNIVHYLLETSNIDINWDSQHSGLALSIAAKNGNIRMVRQLLDWNGHGDNKCPIHIGSPALVHAAKSQNADLLRLILERSHFGINFQMERGNTALINATDSRARASGSAASVRLLLQYGQSQISVNLPNNHGSTALLIAAEFGHDEVVKMLLERSEVNVNLQDGDGDTALICAAEFGHIDIVRMLLEMTDLDPSLRNKIGRTAFFKGRCEGAYSDCQLTA